jgi:hypothetical protein
VPMLVECKQFRLANCSPQRTVISSPSNNLFPFSRLMFFFRWRSSWRTRRSTTWTAWTPA